MVTEFASVSRTNNTQIKQKTPSIHSSMPQNRTAPWDLFSGTSPHRLQGPHSLTKTGLRIRVANDSHTRQQAFALGYKQYRTKCFLATNTRNLMIDAFDADPKTTIFILENAHHEALATVTLVLDSSKGLPCDGTFHDLLEPERTKEFRMGEATRFAISCAEQVRGAIHKVMLNVLFLYARRIAGIETFVIEVNPRHVPFYRKKLLFEPLGPSRSCSRVKGAPAVLMRLDTALQQRAISQIAGIKTDSTHPFARTLYRDFMPIEQEKQWGNELFKQHRPMNKKEIKSLGLEQLKRSAL